MSMFPGQPAIEAPTGQVDELVADSYPEGVDPRWTLGEDSPADAVAAYRRSIAAKSDLEEAVLQRGGRPDAETLGAMTVAAGLTQSKSNEAEQLWSSVRLSLWDDRVC